MPHLKRSAGTTASERQLAEFCEHSFLSMWSYPNLFRDQRINYGTGGGKELCDLLVVCGSDVIIFSEKTCVFPDSGDIRIDWSRWFKRTILAASDQILGAERWLRTHPSRVFLDESCRQPFPIGPESFTDCRFTRIVVAHDPQGRRASLTGGTGTMGIDPDIVGPAHYRPDVQGHRPFVVGQVYESKGFVHVFDAAAMALLLAERDTISDFLAYLRARESFITSRRLWECLGEEDLLAVYLSHADADGRHCFPDGEDGVRTAIIEGSWFDLSKRAEFQAKRMADQQSYAWDAIIEEFSGHAFRGTLYETETPFPDLEKILRIMAMECRLFRRLLAATFLEKLASVAPDMIGVRTMRSPTDQRIGYVFLLYPFSDDVDPGHYRKLRRGYLLNYCIAYAHENRADVDKVVGIATESGRGLPLRSHDLVYFEGPDEWTDEEVALAKEIRSKLRILSPEQMLIFERRFEEYPKAR